VNIAVSFGVSELIIGLTIIAIGTSLPELATSVVAAIRGERDIAVGNVVGSNIMNILAVLGVTGAIIPADIPVSEQALKFDLPVMIAATIACFPIFFSRNRIRRWEGAMFLAYFVIYIGYLVLDSIGTVELDTFRQGMLFFVLPLTGITLLTILGRELRRRYQISEYRKQPKMNLTDKGD
jgi:cation:H+ antiporter